ncbi:BamA/TamA family outer membrane protein [Deinococcus petrolearius]|uniref:BamA/TamA family outer membrane protein n=1 Tax=Deinococcus petrolearius TaxID=1751295 RepID=A0ABW1DEX5_9DEIO
MKPLFLLCSAALLLSSGASAQTSPSSTTTPQVTTSLEIGDIRFDGLTVFTPAQVTAALSTQLGLRVGAQIPATTLEEGRRRIEDSYREAGFPFVPEVKLTVIQDARGKTTVSYGVDETRPLQRVAVSGVSVLSGVQLQTLFGPLTARKRLSLSDYASTLTQLAQAYAQAGAVFRLQDVQAALEGGVLTLKVTEPRVAAVEVSPLSLSTPPSLRTRAGALLSPDALNDDARTLSNLTGRPVAWTAQASAVAGQVMVSFAPLSATGERIRRVAIEGNAQVPEADIRRVLRLREGDVATPPLAQQDFYAVQKLYDDRGAALAATEDSLSFEDGVLTFRLREAKVAGYRFEWPGGKALLSEAVIRRLLPPVGSAVQRAPLHRALAQLQGYDHVQLTGQDTRAEDPQHPEQLTTVLTFADKRSAPVAAGLSYSAQSGLGGEGSFGTNNLLGTGRGLNLTLGANASDVGQVFSGSVNYSVPWIDANFLDFAQRPTSLDLSVWTTASGNNTLYVKGSDGLPTTTDTGRQYTLRSTGGRVALGRTLSDHLSASAGVTVAQTQTYLETYKASDSDDVTTANRSLYQDDTAAGEELPLGALTALSTAALDYDTTDSAGAPSFGVRTHMALGYGIGRQSGGEALSWGQVEAGASTYLGFGRLLPDGQRQEVLAARLNGGTIQGNGGEGNVFSVGSGVVNPAYELRGLSTSLSGTNYVTSSAELRHNFGLTAGNVVTGLYGLAFVDAGSAWRSGTPGLNLSYGVGAQVNTSLINLQLSYGLTTAGSGKFSVRLGQFW